ncbi:hypothetical protein [Erysipelothrix anatis]|uniref:hypothetical protein n=1 Tax=Erysipelothrix anatis TaxID=2683713 RepID=UPI00135A5F26|nr:hypothetical protein [Erysipelothrix anatis]
MTVSKNLQEQNNLVQLRDIVECLAVIKDLHPNWNVSDEARLAKTWHYSLKQFSAHDVKRATLEIAASSKYIPKLADILERLEESSKQSEYVSIGHDSLASVKRLESYLISLTSNERSLFDKRVQEHVINGTGDLNEFEMIYALIMSDLINAYGDTDIKNESIESYMRGEWN